MSASQEQLGCLLTNVSLFSKADGLNVVNGIDENSRLFLEWIPFLSNQKTGIANELLDGAVSSLKEAAACGGLGLVRPALLALRTQIDLILSWVYFKDHRIEWEYLNETGEGFKLKKEILDYLSKNFSAYASRSGILREIKKRKEADPYRLLSAHVHSQSLNTLPLIGTLQDVVGHVETLKELPALAFEVDEYISDILFSIYASSWTQLPPVLTLSLLSRFKSAAQREIFYNGKGSV